MVDADDIGNAAIFGGIPLLLVFVLIYFVYSKPEIDECHAKNGVIVRIEGQDTCIDKAALKPASSKGGA